MSSQTPAEARDVLSSDGVPVTLGAVTGRDVPELLALFAGLSGRSTYQRFCGAGAAGGREFVQVLLDPGRTLDAVCVRWRGELVGVGSTHPVRVDEAELALVVGDVRQGHGLGTLLLEELVRRSRERGIDSLTAVLLGTNSQMRDVLEHSGLPIRLRREDELLVCVVPLDDTAALAVAAERREVTARALSVERLLRPTSVAVVGAGHRRDGVGHQVVAHLRRAGFAGRLSVVNHSGRPVLRVPAVTSVEDLPEHTDLAVLAVPAADVAPALHQLAARQVGAVAVLAATPGDERLLREAQAGIRRACRASGMRMLGPGSTGVLNTDPDVQLDATSFPHATQPGPVLVASQSGAVASGLVSMLARRGLGTSVVVTLGSSSDVVAADLVAFARDDAQTQVVLLYAERLTDPRALLRTAIEVSARKPVVLLAPALTPNAGEGQRPDDDLEGACLDALCRSAGIQRVESLEEMVDLAAVLASQPTPRGGGLAVIGNARGPAMLATAAARTHGLLPADLAQATRMRLRHVLDPDALIGPMVDTASVAELSSLQQALAAVVEDPGVHSVVVTVAPQEKLSAPGVRQVVDAAAESSPGVPIVLCLTGQGGDTSGRVPVFDDPRRAVLALARQSSWALWGRTHPDAPERTRAARTLRATDGRRRAELLIASGQQAHGEQWLEPHVVRDLLRCYGIHVLPTVVLDVDVAASELTEGLVHYPAMLHEHVGPEPRAHGPALALTSPDEVRPALHALATTPSASSKVPQHPRAFDLQPALPQPHTAVSVTARRTDRWGAVLQVSRGGAAPPAPVVLLAPASSVEVRSQLIGRPEGERQALAASASGALLLTDLVGRLSALVDDHPHLVEVRLDEVQVGDREVLVAEAHARVVGIG